MLEGTAKVYDEELARFLYAALTRMKFMVEIALREDGVWLLEWRQARVRGAGA